MSNYQLEMYEEVFKNYFNRNIQIVEYETLYQLERQHIVCVVFVKEYKKIDDEVKEFPEMIYKDIITDKSVLLHPKIYLEHFINTFPEVVL